MYYKFTLGEGLLITIQAQLFIFLVLKLHQILVRQKCLVKYFKTIVNKIPPYSPNHDILKPNSVYFDH